MHFHRDLLIVCRWLCARKSCNVTPDDVFVGSPPLAFTFGFGGVRSSRCAIGATATLLENASPPEMVKIIETYKATICFTSPTAYRAMMAAMDKGADLSSLRLAVSAGETLPAPVFDSWTRKTGKPISRRYRQHRTAAHLHHQPGRRGRRRNDRTSGVWLRSENRRR